MYEIIIILNSHMIRKILVISNINHKNLIMNKKLNSLITDGRNSVLHEYPHASSYGEFGRSSLNHDSCGYPQGGVGYSGESSYNYHAVNSSYHNGGRSFFLSYHSYNNNQYNRLYSTRSLTYNQCSRNISTFAPKYYEKGMMFMFCGVGSL